MTLYNLYMMTMAGAGHTMLMSAGTWGMTLRGYDPKAGQALISAG